MKRALLIIAVPKGIAAGVFTLTCPRFRREIRGSKAPLLAGSTILKTVHGEIEYALQCEEVPRLAAPRRGWR
jgi:hypothetical protein